MSVLDSTPLEPVSEGREALASAVKLAVAFMAPFVLASLLQDPGYQFVAVGMGLIWGWVVTKKSQPVLILLPYIASQLLVFVLATGFLFWATGLAYWGLKGSLSISVLCALFAMLTAYWPVIWRSKKSDIKPRKTSFYTALYSVVCGTVYVCSLVVNYDFT